MGSSLPAPDTHCDFLYRQTFNTYGSITEAGLTQDNRVGNVQKVNNSRLDSNTNDGVLAGSCVAIAGDQLIGPAAGDSSSEWDLVVGVAVNDALGNPYESSSAASSERVVYAHGTGSMFKTDIYETKATDGSTDITYTAGDFVYASQNGLLTNSQGLDNGTYSTLVGIVLKAPSAEDAYMTVQMRI